MPSVDEVKEILAAKLGAGLASFIGSKKTGSDEVRKAVVDLLASMPAPEPVVEVVRDTEDEARVREVMEEPDDTVRLKVTMSMPGSIRFLSGSIR